MIHSFSYRLTSLCLGVVALVGCESTEPNLLQGGEAVLPSPSETAGSPTTAPPNSGPVAEQNAVNAVHETNPVAGAGELPPNHPPLEGVAGSAQGLAWVAPQEWQSQPPSSDMRLAQWSLTGDTSAECAVFNFAGGGTAQDNVQRWVRQFEPTAGVAEEEAEQAEITSNGLTLTLVRAGGTYLAQGPTMTGPVERRPDHRLFGAITTIGEHMYFLKCVGPSATMLAHESRIISLAQSLRPASPSSP